MSISLQNGSIIIGKYLVSNLVIGKGGTARVKFCIDTKTLERYACKIIDISALRQFGDCDRTVKEIEIMRRLRHDNTVTLVDVHVTDTHIYLIMDLISGGELFEELRYRDKFPENIARFYFRQIITGLEYCHGRGVYHRDLKLENCLIDNNGLLKITDFGTAAVRRLQNPAINATGSESMLLHTQCGTPNYVAPEVIMNAHKGYRGNKLDVWASGVILFALLSGSLPFEGEMRDVFSKIVSAKYKYPSYFSPDLTDFLGKLLEPDADKRYTITQIRKHSWFNVPVGIENPSAVRPHKPRKTNWGRCIPLGWPLKLREAMATKDSLQIYDYREDPDAIKPFMLPNSSNVPPEDPLDAYSSDYNPAKAVRPAYRQPEPVRQDVVAHGDAFATTPVGRNSPKEEFIMIIDQVEFGVDTSTLSKMWEKAAVFEEQQADSIEKKTFSALWDKAVDMDGVTESREKTRQAPELQDGTVSEFGVDEQSQPKAVCDTEKYPSNTKVTEQSNELCIESRKQSVASQICAPPVRGPAIPDHDRQSVLPNQTAIVNDDNELNGSIETTEWVGSNNAGVETEMQELNKGAGVMQLGIGQSLLDSLNGSVQSSEDRSSPDCSRTVNEVISSSESADRLTIGEGEIEDSSPVISNRSSIEVEGSSVESTSEILKRKEKSSRTEKTPRSRKHGKRVASEDQNVSDLPWGANSYNTTSDPRVWLAGDNGTVFYCVERLLECVMHLKEVLKEARCPSVSASSWQAKEYHIRCKGEIGGTTVRAKIRICESDDSCRVTFRRVILTDATAFENFFANVVRLYGERTARPRK